MVMVITLNANQTVVAVKLRELYIQAYQVVIGLSCGELSIEQANAEYSRIMNQSEELELKEGIVYEKAGIYNRQ